MRPCEFAEILWHLSCSIPTPLAPIIFPHPLLQDSLEFWQLMLSRGLCICSHNLLEKAFLMTIMLGSSLNTGDHQEYYIRNIQRTLGIIPLTSFFFLFADHVKFYPWFLGYPYSGSWPSKQCLAWLPLMEWVSILISHQLIDCSYKFSFTPAHLVGSRSCRSKILWLDCCPNTFTGILTLLQKMAGSGYIFAITKSLHQGHSCKFLGVPIALDSYITCKMPPFQSFLSPYISYK